jgi:hypothetical protein
MIGPVAACETGGCTFREVSDGCPPSPDMSVPSSGIHQGSGVPIERADPGRLTAAEATYEDADRFVAGPVVFPHHAAVFEVYS